MSERWSTIINVSICYLDRRWSHSDGISPITDYVGQNGGPVGSGDDLECNFEGFGCWDNVAFPTDQFDWNWGTGVADPAKFQDSFGVSQRPSMALVRQYLLASHVKIFFFRWTILGCSSTQVYVHKRSHVHFLYSNVHYKTDSCSFQVRYWLLTDTRISLLPCFLLKTLDHRRCSIASMQQRDLLQWK